MPTKTTTQTISAASYVVANGTTITVTNADAIIALNATTITNDGIVIGSGSAGIGIVLDAASAITNVGTGIISGGSFGIDAKGNLNLVNYGTILESMTLSTAASGAIYAAGNGNVVNSGVIEGGHYGIHIAKYGSVTNSLSGTISGLTGLESAIGGSIVNRGSIHGSDGSGIFLKDGGSVYNSGSLTSSYGTYGGGILIIGAAGNVTNATHGFISGTGDAGVQLTHGGTLVNAGTITSNQVNAVYFKGGAATLIEEAGSVFGAHVSASTAGGVVNTIDLAATSAGLIGTIVNPGNYFGFSTLNVDSGADWLIGSGSIAGITTVNDDGTLTQLGTAINSVFIDKGAHDTASGAGLAGFTATFGTLGTPSAPNVLDLSNTTATSFAGHIVGFGVNDQIDLGDFTSLPTGVSITTAGTAGSIGPVVITGTVGGATKNFTISNISLASGQTLHSELSGQQIVPGGSLILASTSSGIALEIGDSIVTLANASPYTLASGLTLAVPGATADIVNNGGPTTLVNNGVISGASYGVSLTSATAVTDTVTNTGTITHTGAGIDAGVDFQYNVGGFVSNSGYIGGPAGTGVFLKTNNSLSDTVTNSGTIGGTTGFSVVDGLSGTGTDQFTNTGSITNGVFLGGSGAGGTVFNAGIIGTYAGTGANAHIAIDDKATALLILDAGQSLSNGVATFGAGSTLDLAAGSAGVIGTIANPGSYFGFTTLNIIGGADWSLGGSIAGVTAITDLGTLNVTAPIGGAAINLGNGTSNGLVNFSGTDLTNTNTIANAITGFGPTDTIIIGATNFATSAGDNLTTAYSAGVLTITDTNTGKSIVTDITNPTAGSASNFAATRNSNGALIITDIPCFAAGTRILTPDGETKVENLAVGNTVLTARNGAVQKIVWTGQRTIDLTRHPNPEKVTPVTIIAGAFGPGLPERNLTLSPDHALFINNHLIEAKTLVNGATIIRNRTTLLITYHHIELEQHDVVLAEGLPTETYLDSGNRQNFTTKTGATTLHPDFAATSRAKSCAPLLTDGYIVRATRHQLLNRAIELGFTQTDIIDLTAKAGTEHIAPTIIHPGAIHFTLPANAKTVSLVSSTGVPAELSANPSDRRTLGVAITKLVLVTEGKRQMIDLNDTAHQGLSAAEPGHRWTEGNARIALPAYAGKAVLEVTLNGQAKRWTTTRHRATA